MMGGKGSMADRMAQQQRAQLLLVKLVDVSKVGCKDDGANAYLCDFQYTAQDAKGHKKSDSMHVRAIKGANGWELKPVS